MVELWWIRKSSPTDALEQRDMTHARSEGLVRQPGPLRGLGCGGIPWKQSCDTLKWSHKGSSHEWFSAWRSLWAPPKASTYIYVIIGIEPSMWAGCLRPRSKTVQPIPRAGWLVCNLGLGQLSPHLEALFLKLKISISLLQHRAWPATYHQGSRLGQ